MDRENSSVVEQDTNTAQATLEEDGHDGIYPVPPAIMWTLQVQLQLRIQLKQAHGINVWVMSTFLLSSN